MSFSPLNNIVCRLTMNKERNIGAPCGYRDCHGNSVPFPDRDSRESPHKMSTRFMELMRRGNIEYRRTYELRSEEKQLQRPSMRMSIHKPLVVVLPRKKMAHA